MQHPGISLTDSDAICLLQWYLAMGVDETIAQSPQLHIKARTPLPATDTAKLTPASSSSQHTNLKTLASAHITPLEYTGSPTPLTVTQGFAAAKAQAVALADSASTLEALENAVLQFGGCALKKTAMKTVFIDGNRKSQILIVGEAPGQDEDRQGIPFCGVSGKLLDSMLQYAGLNRSKDYLISNTVFWRPPGNRQPTEEEIALCRPFVEKLIALVNPKCILLVGGTATKALLHDTRGISKLRGNIFFMQIPHLQNPIKTFVTFHPSYLLRQPLARQHAWSDMLAFADAATAI